MLDDHLADTIPDGVEAESAGDKPALVLGGLVHQLGFIRESGVRLKSK